MTPKSTVIKQTLITIFLLLVLFSILATWYNTMVIKNFVIIDDTKEELIEESE